MHQFKHVILAIPVHWLSVCTSMLCSCRLLHGLPKRVLPSCHSQTHWPIETCLTSFSAGPAHRMQLNSKLNFWLQSGKFCTQICSVWLHNKDTTNIRSQPHSHRVVITEDNTCYCSCASCTPSCCRHIFVSAHKFWLNWFVSLNTNQMAH